jgi:indole-3-glycerol phosphate synthase
VTGNTIATGTILDEIVRWKHTEIAQRKQARPLDVVQGEAAAAGPARDLAVALQAPGVSLIAEIKRASPSKGVLRPDLDPLALAHVYQDNGAAAISVLTDARFFGGDLEHLRIVRQAVALPVLRKDFILEPYQAYEARAAGADAVLLIVAALGDADLAALCRLAGDLGMGAVVEVHDERELERALRIGPRIVGVNNRDLRTFQVSLETTARLRQLVPGEVIMVAESGVHTPADVARLQEIGVDAMLVGESLMRAGDVGRKVRELARKDVEERLP